MRVDIGCILKRMRPNIRIPYRVWVHRLIPPNRLGKERLEQIYPRLKLCIMHGKRPYRVDDLGQNNETIHLKRA